ncbi:evasin P672-like isoform X1 [Dermacentor silvarum]|uniref:evasin P672-like isoform X1 n=1 Tax=Dermacentor silvarum TaxID=543639 RepID=UPI002100E4E7|nr:evasin P672-like isoform X1 [Dermacentor silvarum]
MAHKKSIALVAALYAMHIISGICEDSEGSSNSYEEYEDGTAPVTCYKVNSTAGLISNNCTVSCYNATSSWNQTDPDNETCYYGYTDLQRSNGGIKIYNCSLGSCNNGTCIPNGQCAECW